MLWGGGKATWTATYNGYLTAPGPCEEARKIEGFEVVGAGDFANVTWKQLPRMGLRVIYFA